MGTLQVSNLHFESTGNNRIQYTGANAFNLVAGGQTVATVNTTSVSFPLALSVNTITSNGTLLVNNLYFDSTGNNRIQYTGANAFNWVAGGETVATVNTTALTANTIIANGTLRTSNLHFESTGNNRIQYTGANSFNLIAGGQTVATVNTTAINSPLALSVNTIIANGTLGSAADVLQSNGSSVYWSPIVADSIPLGTIVDFAGTSAPSKWIFGFGQNVSRSTYAALFAILGTTYGAGDGSTTFTLPDFRGRVVAGKDDMGGTSANRLTNQTGGLNGDILGAVGGVETHVLTVAELASHQHGVAGDGGASPYMVNPGAFRSGASILSAPAGSSQAHNNVQPTIILNKIIYAGV